MCDPCCPPICSPYCPSEDSSCDPCIPPECCIPCDPCCQIPSCPPRRCKSRELKGSVLITQCECVKRNGLQLDCPRTECHGRPCCTTKPWPSCCPSKYMWRYTNVPMGKSSNARSTSCRPKVTGCNPCVIEDECCPCE